MYMHTFSVLLVLGQVGLPLVRGAPLPPDPIIIGPDDRIVYLAEHPDHRIAAIILCIFYAFLLALAQGEYGGTVVGGSLCLIL
jgi:hypothetical protein